MDLINLHDLRLALKLAGIKPDKGLGQHFLVDQPSLEAIVSAAKVSSKDTVLEIGPGLGVMTELLAKQAKSVVAVESDHTLAEILKRRAASNVSVVEENILNFNLKELPLGYKVVANLPYYLTSQILRSILESSNRPSLMSVLVQKEVAQRITATPGQMSVLALSVQYYGQPILEGVVMRHKFWPPPKVDSAILRIKVLPSPKFEADASKLFRLIKAGFGERRKQLKNALAGGLNVDPAKIEQVLREAKIPPLARAQELGLAEWQKLYRLALAARLLN